MSEPEVDALAAILHPFVCNAPQNVPHYAGNYLYQPCGKGAAALVAAGVTFYDDAKEATDAAMNYGHGYADGLAALAPDPEP